MKKALIASTVVLTGLFGLGLKAWAYQEDPEDPPFSFAAGAPRLLGLLDSDRVRNELGLSDEQTQRLRQVVVEAEKSAVKAGADVAVHEIELRELLHSDSPDRNAVMNKVQEISNLRGEMMKQHVGAFLDAKAVFNPEQQKKIRALIERWRAAEEARRQDSEQ